MSKDSETTDIRAFIAIELPLPVREQLLLLENNLKSKLNIPASWVTPDNIHLTLKFMASVPQERVPFICDALTTVGEQFSPFFLELDVPGAFPNTKHPRVLWVGLSGEIKNLTNLHNDIDAVLYCLGFPRESRPFSPHLTLCRIRENLPAIACTNMGDALNTVGVEDRSRFKVNGITLFKSQLTPAGPAYTRLVVAEFGAKQK